MLSMRDCCKVNASDCPLSLHAHPGGDSSKDVTLKLTLRRSLFKDQDNVSHKRISSVQHEAKSGPINIHPRVQKVTLMAGQVRSRHGQQQRDRRNKASSLTLLAACQSLLQKLSGDIKVILN
ncbi:hypothetical protein CHARACLAT_028244 [Characodon lateralis]|uniref:Uncharacterized protein n=1 Tax=Characodon lateralis TaxID=208331 RepID=A0ABU7EP85_9TELE|nr:hypothetical protein [Characodon lateralis]